jgi:hypothetical protein
VKTSEVLRKAGDVLRERGWCQQYREHEGSHCLVGAVEMARKGTISPFSTQESSLAYRDPALSFLPIEESVDSFNDRTGRTREDVLVTLDAAYVLALQEEGLEPEDVL